MPCLPRSSSTFYFFFFFFNFSNRNAISLNLNNLYHIKINKVKLFKNEIVEMLIQITHKAVWFLCFIFFSFFFSVFLSFKLFLLLFGSCTSQIGSKTGSVVIVVSKLNEKETSGNDIKILTNRNMFARNGGSLTVVCLFGP